MYISVVVRWRCRAWRCTTTDGTLLSATCVVTVGDAVAGDVNDDNHVDVDDLNIVINVILDINQEPATVALCDVNGDSHVDVDDLNLLINVILGTDSAGTPIE